MGENTEKLEEFRKKGRVGGGLLKERGVASSQSTKQKKERKRLVITARPEPDLGVHRGNPLVFQRKRANLWNKLGGLNTRSASKKRKNKKRTAHARGRISGYI